MMPNLSFDISVLVLCYNASEFINQCLTSILNQKTNCSIQVVVMDDHSVDDTYSLVLQFIQNNELENITFETYAQDKNKGCYTNMIDGINHCTGDVIAYLEADDYWVDNNKLDDQYKFLINQETYIGIGGGCQFVDEKGNPTEQKYYLQEDRRVFDYKSSWDYPQFQTSTFAFLNIAKLRIHHNLSFSQCNDKVLFEFLTRLKPIIYLPKKTTAYRNHGGNITAKRSKTSIYLHHVRVNFILLLNSGIQKTGIFLYAFLKLSYIWVNDLIKGK